MLFMHMCKKDISSVFQFTGHSDTLEGPFKAGSVSSGEVKYFTVLGVDLKISVQHQLELITLMHRCFRPLERPKYASCKIVVSWVD